MHLFRAIFFGRPISQTQAFRYRPSKQNKRFCYRLMNQNKTTLRTMRSNFLKSTDPSMVRTVSFNLWEPAVPSNDSLLASKTKVLTSGNRQFLAMVTSGYLVPRERKVSTSRSRQFLAMVAFGYFGSHVGDDQFPSWEPGVPTSGSRQFLAMVTYVSHVSNRKFQPLGTGSSLP